MQQQSSKLRGEPEALNLTASDATVTVGETGIDYETICNVTVTGGTEPYTITVDSGNEDTSAAGSYDVTISVEDAVSATDSETVTITVVAARSANVATEFSEMNFKELQEEAKSRGLKPGNSKKAIIEQLEELE